MQLDLFSNQKPDHGSQESYGTIARRALLREARYQADKNESDTLQKQWLTGKNSRMVETQEKRKERTALITSEPITLVLVSCVSRKSATASKARNLYISDWFVKARQYAENIGDKWMILSARHGLLDPETLIEPYDETLYGKRKREREFWAKQIVSSLKATVPPNSKIIILAGEIYREFLTAQLEDSFRLEIPLKNYGIGKQLAYLKRINEK